MEFKSLDEIKNANKELATISVTDELTGILNRRGFFENIKKLIDEETLQKRVKEIADQINKDYEVLFVTGKNYYKDFSKIKLPENVKIFQ